MASPASVEFLGTSLLISAVAFGSSPLLIVAALAIAIAFGGKVSGGHFNPAVTLFQYMNGRVSRNRALMYVAAQFAAGVAIAFLRSVI
jgi:glycerol uptake facilitator-like aquaporin